MFVEVYFQLLTQSKSKTTITRSVHGKFNRITFQYNGTQHGIYLFIGPLLNFPLGKYLLFVGLRIFALVEGKKMKYEVISQWNEMRDEITKHNFCQALSIHLKIKFDVLSVPLCAVCKQERKKRLATLLERVNLCFLNKVNSKFYFLFLLVLAYVTVGDNSDLEKLKWSTSCFWRVIFGK